MKVAWVGFGGACDSSRPCFGSLQVAEQDIEVLVQLAKEGNSLGAHAEAQRLQSEFSDIRCAIGLVR